LELKEHGADRKGGRRIEKVRKYKKNHRKTWKQSRRCQWRKEKGSDTARSKTTGRKRRIGQ